MVYFTDNLNNGKGQKLSSKMLRHSGLLNQSCHFPTVWKVRIFIVSGTSGNVKGPIHQAAQTNSRNDNIISGAFVLEVHHLENEIVEHA